MSKDEDQAKRVFEGVLYDVYQWEQTEFDGSKKTYEKVVRRFDSVEMVVVEDGKIMLLREEQPGWDEPGLVLPSGKMEADEAPETAAKRELAEETGRQYSNFELLSKYDIPGKVRHTFHVFLVKGKYQEVTVQTDPGEKIEIVWFTIDEFISLVRQQKLRYLTKVFEEILLKDGDEAVHKLLDD